MHAATGHAAAAPRDELASFQLIKVHSIPASQGGLKDIELARIGQSGLLRKRTSDLALIVQPRRLVHDPWGDGEANF